MLLGHKDELLCLTDFGNSVTLNESSEAVKDAVKFVSWLYYPKSEGTTDINSLWYKRFCQKKLSGEKLPPTHDALILHLKRANYQCYIWKHATTPNMDIPSPVGDGWMNDAEGNLVQCLMEQPPAPEAIAEFTLCKCRKGCRRNACSCLKFSLLCTDACACSDFECENTVNENESDSYDDESDDE